MADTSIQRDFIDGVQEVFTTLFNEGISDGVEFYPFHNEESDIYGEVPYKEYLPPVYLVAKVELFPKEGNTDVEAQKEDATFTITYKSLAEVRGIDVSNKNLAELRKGYIKYKDTFYEINDIKPRAYVEDVFLLYEFHCVEDLEVDELIIYIDTPEEDEETQINGDENE